MTTTYNIEETPQKMIIKMEKPEKGGGGRNVSIRDIAFIITLVIILLYFIWNSFPAWLFWICAVAALLMGFFVYSFFKRVMEKRIQESTVSIDIVSQRIIRVEKLKSGKIKQYDLELTKLNQVVINSEEVGHGFHLRLENLNNDDEFHIASGTFVEGATITDLGKKIGNFLSKPVVLRYTDGGKLMEEKTILN